MSEYIRMAYNASKKKLANCAIAKTIQVATWRALSEIA